MCHGLRVKGSQRRTSERRGEAHGDGETGAVVVDEDRVARAECPSAKVKGKRGPRESTRGSSRLDGGGKVADSKVGVEVETVGRE